MADGLNMGNLSLNESQHAPQGQPAPAGRAPYIPPHLRQRTVNTNVDGAAAPPPAAPGAFAPKYAYLSFLLPSRGWIRLTC